MIINLMGKMTHLTGKNILDFILVYCVLLKVTNGLFFLVYMCTHLMRKKKAVDDASTKIFEKFRVKT